MINRLQLLRNVGSFDSVNSGANIPLNRLTLVYAENGRGKTTFAAILRSLATGNSIPIASQAVFARYLNVSTKLVQAWEANHRTPDGPALVLLHIAARQPHLIESVRQDAQADRPRQSRRRHERAQAVAS